VTTTATLSGPRGAPAILVGYPWTPGNARYMASAGGLSLPALLDNIDGLIATLSERYRVIAFESPPGIEHGRGYPADLTGTRVTADYLRAADAAAVERFAVLGYSWGACAAIELASHSPRCSAIAVGGWPPLNPPIPQLRATLRADAADPRRSTHDQEMLRMYSAYYDSVATEPAAPALPIPRLLFYGQDDREPMSSGTPSVAELVEASRPDLEGEGWVVDTVPGRDHLSCICAAVVGPMVRAFLSRHEENL
jgi:pimeloyl-ACP methyl ester carboxylesterase